MKSELVAFGRPVAAALVAAWAVGAYPLYRMGSGAITAAVAAGCAVALLNAIAGCLTAVWAIDKPQRAFLKAVFGGMTARLLLMGAVFFLLIRLTEIHPAGLTFSLFGFYVVFQVVELRFLVGRLKGKGTPESTGEKA